MQQNMFVHMRWPLLLEWLKLGQWRPLGALRRGASVSIGWLGKERDPADQLELNKESIQPFHCCEWQNQRAQVPEQIGSQFHVFLPPGFPFLPGPPSDTVDSHRTVS